MAVLGLIVNPIAGMGGRVGLKGTDGESLLERARALGALPGSGERAARALARIALRSPGGLRVLAAAGGMGAELAVSSGLPSVALPVPARDGATTAADTRTAAELLVRRGVDLVLFAGGDGTARDVQAVVGERVPILGIPSGVKMHSGVFATTPEAAGEVAAAFLAAGVSAGLREAEVVDLEETTDAAAISTRLYGAARVPDDRLRVQHAKAGPTASDEGELDAVCAGLAATMDPRRIYVLGPGTTMRRVMGGLGLDKTLLGVDAVRGGRLLGRDLAERDLLALLEGEAATLLLGVVGGQGSLFGRGNLPLSPAVVREIGTGNVQIVAGLRKLLALDPAVLHVDTGDAELDAELSGYRPVHVAPRRTLIAEVAA